MSDCNICKAYLIGPHHKCPPKWLVIDKDWCGNDWDDAYEVFALDAEDAAKEGAEKIDDKSGDGPQERTIFVKSLAGEITGPYEITFDYSVNYYAELSVNGSDVS
jgi:hypothetical protein